MEVTIEVTPTAAGFIVNTASVTGNEVDPDDSDNTATAVTDVKPVNHPPVADPQAVTTAEDTPVAIMLTGSDPEGDPLTFAIVTPPAHGDLSGTPPSVTYTPAPDFHGSDSFTFKVNDGKLDSDPATVTITVTPVNDAPVAVDDAYSVEEDNTLTVGAPGVLANDTDVDGDPLTVILVSGPSHGTLRLRADGSFRYTPDAGFSGTDSFTYKATDGSLDSNLATVTITVTPVNDAPVADSQFVTTDEDVPVVITLTGSDKDGDPLTFSIVTGPAHGALSAIGPPSCTGGVPNLCSAPVTYTPDADFSGADRFTFKVSDGELESNVETVAITVLEGDLPVETFEGEFPGRFWFVGDVTPAGGEVFWDDTTCGSPFQGTSHAWSAGIGRPACTTYANNMDAIMYVEAEYFGLSADNTDFISLAVRQGMADLNDFGYLYVQGYDTMPPHGQKGSPLAEGYCLFNDIPGDCASVTQLPDYTRLKIRLGPAFDAARFVRVIIGFHSDASGVAAGTFVDVIDFHRSPDHQIFPIPGGFHTIAVTPHFLGFGPVRVGGSKDRLLIVTNLGNQTLRGSCTTAVPFSLPEGCDFTLAAGESKPIRVRFSPTIPGLFHRTVVFSSDGGHVSRAVRGRGRYRP